MSGFYCNDSSPTNSVFYSCDYGSRFLGCCADTSPNEVCEHGCSGGSVLEVAIFNSFDFDPIDKQSCEHTDGGQEGTWYTCPGDLSAFLGCCTIDPCPSGCPLENLVAAQLSTETNSKGIFSSVTF